MAQHGHRLTQLRIAVLGLPNNLARLSVEGIKFRVQRGHKNLAVGISHAAIYDIAAGH